MDLAGIDAHVSRKYKILSRLGKGAYGVVYKAEDSRGNSVAIKKCFDAFQNATDAQRTFREIWYLSALRHPNIVDLRSVIKAENNKDIYVVTDFMESDLHVVIKQQVPLLPVHKQYISYQIIKGLKYLHSAKVVIRDLKPSNVLINSDCSVRLCDFGLARSIINQTPSHQAVMTEYTATRWYRAPEILLGGNYGLPIDMWALGCVIGELILMKPLFPGTSTIHQIELIIEMTGFPNEEQIASVESKYANTILDSIGSKGSRKSISNNNSNISSRQAIAGRVKTKIPEASSDCVDLLSRLFRFNPYQRLDINKCIEHPFVSEFRDLESETVYEGDLVIPFDDNVKLTVDDYRNQIYEEIKLRRRAARKSKRESRQEDEPLDL
jgi:mitogen-activated protein kinase 15